MYAFRATSPLMSLVGRYFKRRLVESEPVRSLLGPCPDSLQPPTRLQLLVRALGLQDQETLVRLEARLARSEPWVRNSSLSCSSYRPSISYSSTSSSSRLCRDYG
jgi:hypothetical protein